MTIEWHGIIHPAERAAAISALPVARVDLLELHRKTEPRPAGLT